MFCTISHPDGTPYKKDCRTLLLNAEKKARKEFGVEFSFGTEIEFYLFKLDEKGEPTKVPFDNAGYMDIAPEDKGENIRREICFTLEQMGMQPESSHHEEGPGQNEIDFHHSDALTAADNAATFKWIVRTIEGTTCDISHWQQMVDTIHARKDVIQVALVGKYVKLHDSYLSIVESLNHASFVVGKNLRIKWVDSDTVTDETAPEVFADCAGIILPGGFGHQS